MENRSFRKDDQGIALVEAVIAVPFFLIVWMGLIGMHHLYAGRLAAQVEAERRALVLASAGCRETGAVDRSGDLAAGQRIPDEQAGWIAALAGDLPFVWSHVDATASLIVTGIPSWMGGPERTVRGRQRMMCNMEPKDGLMDMITELVKDVLDIDF